MKRALKALYLRAREAALKPLYVPAEAPPDPSSLRSVLLLRCDRIGDMVQATPLLEALREDLPLAGLSVLASEANAPVLEGFPGIERVYALPRSGRAAALAGLQRRGFDLVIDPSWEYGMDWPLLARRLGGRWRLGLDWSGRALWYNLRVPGPLPPAPAAELMLELCRRGLGLPLRSRPPRLHLREGEKAAARRRLAEAGLDPGRPLVLAHPGGHYPEQRWAIEGFAAVAELLSSSWQVLLAGGPSEEPLLRRASALAPGARALAFPSLREFMAALSCARLLVCNNSGPMHLACALGVRTLSLMGPTDPVLWSPPAPHRVLRRDPLSRLEAGEVARAALAVLEGRD